ncbi:hypothetical protein PAPYR_10094 [Paratrimastix pyriformis]|uniref:Uncharacterized protein n=1 Tax=Paratrimastix pyriformis TaxID=342808 RepID=A0ABQ8U6S4_9EUKA|nr:hypothetical protein PAPYR_10094 [Paratrimastix pyriformis]
MVNSLAHGVSRRVEIAPTIGPNGNGDMRLGMNLAQIVSFTEAAPTPILADATTTSSEVTSVLSENALATNSVRMFYLDLFFRFINPYHGLISRSVETFKSENLLEIERINGKLADALRVQLYSAGALSAFSYGNPPLARLCLSEALNNAGHIYDTLGDEPDFEEEDMTLEHPNIPQATVEAARGFALLSACFRSSSWKRSLHYLRIAAGLLSRCSFMPLSHLVTAFNQPFLFTRDAAHLLGASGNAALANAATSLLQALSISSAPANPPRLPSPATIPLAQPPACPDSEAQPACPETEEPPPLPPASCNQSRPPQPQMQSHAGLSELLETISSSLAHSPLSSFLRTARFVPSCTMTPLQSLFEYCDMNYSQTIFMQALQQQVRFREKALGAPPSHFGGVLAYQRAVGPLPWEFPTSTTGSFDHPLSVRMGITVTIWNMITRTFHVRISDGFVTGRPLVSFSPFNYMEDDKRPFNEDEEPFLQWPEASHPALDMEDARAVLTELLLMRDMIRADDAGCEMSSSATAPPAPAPPQPTPDDTEAPPDPEDAMETESPEAAAAAATSSAPDADAAPMSPPASPPETPPRPAPAPALLCDVPFDQEPADMKSSVDVASDELSRWMAPFGYYVLTAMFETWTGNPSEALRFANRAVALLRAQQQLYGRPSFMFIDSPIFPLVALGEAYHFLLTTSHKSPAEQPHQQPVAQGGCQTDANKNLIHLLLSDPSFQPAPSPDETVPGHARIPFPLPLPSMARPPVDPTPMPPEPAHPSPVPGTVKARVEPLDHNSPSSPSSPESPNNPTTPPEPCRSAACQFTISRDLVDLSFHNYGQVVELLQCYAERGISCSDYCARAARRLYRKTGRVLGKLAASAVIEHDADDMSHHPVAPLGTGPLPEPSPTHKRSSPSGPTAGNVDLLDFPLPPAEADASHHPGPPASHTRSSDQPTPTPAGAFSPTSIFGAGVFLGDSSDDSPTIDQLLDPNLPSLTRQANSAKIRFTLSASSLEPFVNPFSTQLQSHLFSLFKETLSWTSVSMTAIFRLEMEYLSIRLVTASGQTVLSATITSWALSQYTSPCAIRFIAAGLTRR